MDFEETIKKRQSVRSYLPKNVPEEVVKKILKLANLSPSAGNLQARKVVVIKDQNLRRKLKDVCRGFGGFLNEPPVIFVVCSLPEESATKYGSRGRNLYALQDATIFASYLQLAAVSLGLASCWVGSFDENLVSEILKLPENLVPVAMIPVGFSEENPPEKSRKTLADLCITT